MLAAAKTKALASSCGTSNSRTFANSVSTTVTNAANTITHAASVHAVPPGSSSPASNRKLSCLT